MLSWVSFYAKPPYWERDLANESEVSFWFVFKEPTLCPCDRLPGGVTDQQLTVSLLLLAKAHWKSRYSARCRKQLNIAGFLHRNQEAAVRWSSRRFGLSIRKEGQLQLLDLLNSVLGRAGKSRNSKNSAAQPLLSSSYRKSVSSSDRSMTSSLQQQTLNNGPSSTATLAVLVLKHMAP